MKRSGSSSEKPVGAAGLQPKLRDGFASSPSILPSPSIEPLSPPRQTCCFGCSKREPWRKSKGKGKAVLASEMEAGHWGKNEEILSDLSTFSFKEQQRRMKKALEEEAAATREAERVVKWVKQASARMDVSTVDKLLIEDELK